MICKLPILIRKSHKFHLHSLIWSFIFVESVFIYKLFDRFCTLIIKPDAAYAPFFEGCLTLILTAGFAAGGLPVSRAACNKQCRCQREAKGCQ